MTPSSLDAILFYRELGIGVRLRRLLERLTSDCDQLYSEGGYGLRVSGFYAFYAIAEKSPLTIGDISQLAGFSQSAVSQTVAKLIEDGLVDAVAGSDIGRDGRQKYLTLSPLGRKLRQELKPFWQKFDHILKDLITESGHDLIKALDSLEILLNQQSFYDRFQAAAILAAPEKTKDKKTAHSDRDALHIIAYDQRYAQAFYDLNITWLKQYFVVEPIDEKILANPNSAILDHGGEIIFAIQNEKAVGCVALKNEGDGVFEFTKYAVDPACQGFGIGQKLMIAALERFQARSGKKLYLETNTSLKAARALYDRNGWHEVTQKKDSPYARANCMMIWEAPCQASNPSNKPTSQRPL